MTPKEKAEELVGKYLNKNINFPYIDSEDGQCIGAGYMTYCSATQCALIAVDEMIELCESYVAPYYYEVKQEIEKL
jgi:hypothetical protein